MGNTSKSSRGERLRALMAVILAGGMMTGSAFADENAQLTVKSIPNVNIRMYGFVETDVINDSAQGLTEELDNAAVAKASTYAGQHHRTIISARNSRLGFDVGMPKTDGGLATNGVFELDFMGNQAVNAAPGTTPGTQTERDFFNNPTVRVRHAYLNMSYQDWNAKFGQYWSLLGWQPYYFPSEPIVQPAIGQFYRRFPQVRVTNTHVFNDAVSLETAFDAAKPADFDSGLTDYHAGLRVASTKIKSAAGLSSGSSMVGLSAGVSAAYIPVHTSSSTATGSAVVFDVHIPIIPSSDGKSMANNLSLTGEFGSGQGIGGLELAGATGGVGAVSSAVLPVGSTSGPLDSGIAGVDTNRNIQLIHFQTWRTNLTYVLPNPKWALGAGYAETRTTNLQVFGAGTGLIPRYQYYYGNAFYMPLSWLKWAVEWAQIKNTYNDANNRFAYDNRIQFTTYISF